MEVKNKTMNTGVTVSGIVLFIIGLIALGASAFYASFAGEVVSSVITVLGAIVGGVGTALHTTPRRLDKP